MCLKVKGALIFRAPLLVDLDESTVNIQPSAWLIKQKGAEPPNCSFNTFVDHAFVW